MNEIETPLKYLRKILDIDNDFLAEWRRLTQKDKDDLKEYAEEEIKHNKSKQWVICKKLENVLNA